MPSTASASLEYPGDIDCFSIQPAAAGTLTVATAGNLDTWGVLFENGSDVAADDDSGTGDNFSITHPAVPGMTYVICAEAYDTTSTGAYSLQVSQTTGDDHGDTSAAATTVGLISSTQGALGHSGDVDVFQFVVPSPQWVDLETWGSTDTKGTLKNSSGVVQDSDDDCADGLSLNFCISHYLSSGTYTIEVEHYSTVGTGSYSLMMNPIQ